FTHFVEEGGRDLANFALWSALAEANESPILPDEIASSTSPSADRARLELADRIEFWEWCQWIVSQQMQDAQRVATDVGMDIGIMADL
ncbi:4-alpha-glucanotransferase, partial [Streptococcus anginosus]|uniref:4-alpha-glucanotransferase n=2 Tax=Bacillati TaxID=1783272 RepID=UPI0021F8EE74